VTHVLVVGSGLAGLIAAIRATDAGHTVTLVTKAALRDSNTRYAQGGIAAAMFPDDSVESHVVDTLRAGAGLCDPIAVQVLCTEGPDRVRDLIRFGVNFDRDESGVTRGLEAAHSRSRVLHSGGDATGAAIEVALVTTVRERAERAHTLPSERAGYEPRLIIREHTMLVDLIVPAGRVAGAVLLGPDGKLQSVAADSVILATGGAGSLYPHTPNPALATGDGVAAAWRAGAVVADLEFYQFHPTALFVPGTPLVSEAVRGEGAVLRNALGTRFMLDVHPGAELAPRDVVARSIAHVMAQQNGTPVLLDATGLGRDLLETRFPSITAACRLAGVDWAAEPIPVAPAAHYWMGGVVTDTWGRASLPGLFAVGETARTGAHGANRLASNSLLEAAVFADRAVRALGGALADPAAAPERGVPVAAVLPAAAVLPVADRDGIQRIMWQYAGVLRSGEGLATAAATLAGWTRPATGADAAPGQEGQIRAYEDANLFDLARITIAAALGREESRGAHYRSDFPASRPELAHMFAHSRGLCRGLCRHTPEVVTEAEEAIAC
jgi:L-aspartate oxidase